MPSLQGIKQDEECLNVDLEDKEKLSGTLTEELIKITMETPLSSFCWKMAAGKKERETAAVNMSNGNPQFLQELREVKFE